MKINRGLQLNSSWSASIEAKVIQLTVSNLRLVRLGSSHETHRAFSSFDCSNANHKKSFHMIVLLSNTNAITSPTNWFLPKSCFAFTWRMHCSCEHVSVIPGRVFILPPLTLLQYYQYYSSLQYFDPFYS